MDNDLYELTRSLIVANPETLQRFDEYKKDLSMTAVIQENPGIQGQRETKTRNVEASGTCLRDHFLK